MVVEKRLQTCIIVRNHVFTNVNYSEHVETGYKTAYGADHCVVDYLPSADSSQLPERRIHFHLHFVYVTTTTTSSSLSSLAAAAAVLVTMFQHTLEIAVSQTINKTTDKLVEIWLHTV